MPLIAGSVSRDTSSNGSCVSTQQLETAHTNDKQTLCTQQQQQQLESFICQLRTCSYSLFWFEHMGWVQRETRTVNSYNVFVGGVHSKLLLFPNYFECLPIHIICRRSKFRTISYNFSAHITIKGHETFLFYLQIQRSEPIRRDRRKERLTRAY